jgi:hypothetical protein
MAFRRFAFLLLLLAAAIGTARADSAPQERLYFLRADRSAFAITFQDGQPRAIRRLYSGWAGVKFSSEMLRWGHEVGAGPTTEDRPLATYLGDQVHSLGDSMVIETDYRMQLWSTFVPYPIGGSRSVTEPDHPDGARLRRLLYFRPGSSGSWDCFARNDFEPDVKDQEGEAARQVALWRTTPPGRIPVATDDLLLVPTEDLVPLLKTAETDPRRRRRAPSTNSAPVFPAGPLPRHPRPRPCPDPQRRAPPHRTAQRRPPHPHRRRRQLLCPVYTLLPTLAGRHESHPRGPERLRKPRRHRSPGGQRPLPQGSRRCCRQNPRRQGGRSILHRPAAAPPALAK